MGDLNTHIQDVNLVPLKIIDNSLGDVFHGMKKSDIGFNGFEEVYFSTVPNHIIKPWKKHLMMTLNIIVISGEIKFVLFDDREDSKTKNHFMEVILSLNNYKRLNVPPNIWMAFKGMSKNKNILLNISNLEHDQNEIIREKINTFKYNW